MHPSPPRNKDLYLAFDIETTGQWLKSDVCFGIGYCMGYGDGAIIEEGKWMVDLGANQHNL